MSSELLIRSLQAVRRRARLLDLARGLGIALAVAAGALLATVLLDYCLNLRSAPRLFVIAAAVGTLAWAAARWVIRPAAQGLSLSDIAARLERAFPQFDDRLRSTLDFLKGHVPGSEAMKQRVVEQTMQLAATLDLPGAVVARPALVSLGGAAGSIIALLLLALFAGEQLRSIAIARLLQPLADRPWPKRVQIAADGELPTRVPVGQRLEVRMTLLRGDRPSIKPVVCYQYDNGPVEQEVMSRAPEGAAFSASLDARVDAVAALGHLHVWMKAGDDRLDLPPITVVPRLAVKSVEAIVSPPSYVTGAQPTMVNLSAAPAVMAVGSDVALRITLNKPLTADNPLTLEPVADAGADGAPSTQPAAVPRAAWEIQCHPGGDTLAIGRFTAVDPLRFHVHAVDADGFSNNALEEYELIVRPDQLPSVQIENPRRNEERTAVATVPLAALAEDDYGINSLKLVVDRIQRAGEVSTPSTQPAASHWEIPLVDRAAASAGVNWQRIEGTGDRQRFRANYAWDLTSLDSGLRSGDVLEYYLLVTDNFNLHGQTHPAVASSKLRLTILSQDELANHVIADLQAARTQVDEARRAQLRSAQETANLADDLGNRAQLNQADRIAAERLTGEQSAIAGQTRQIATKIENISQRLAENKSPEQELKDLTRDVGRDLNEAAENSMKRSAQQLSQARDAKKAADAKASLTQARDAQAQAGDDLQRAMDRMGDVGSLQQTIARINDLLRQQQQLDAQLQDASRNNLGKLPDDLSPEDRQKLNAAADAQQKLADRTASAVDAMKKSAQQLSKSDPATAEAMARAAETAQQQQVAPSQQKAAEQARQNQQGSAQASQKQAELGLQMIVDDLRQAESRKLAELSKQLAELQQQVANLLRRQAGHNLDNLTVQGAAAMAKLDAQALADLRKLAERDPAAAQSDPDPDRLAPSQEQTERNTRDISKTAQAMPDGAEPAAQLLRAAGHMERAIVSLADAKLAEAYDPPQVDALAALQAASKIIAAQQAKVDDQIASSQKEAVRQKYIEIRDDQQKLNAETARITAARGPTGELPRRDLIRLGQLPGEQGKLADRTADLNKVLEQVGSIVFIWANKDIVESMNQVKADLPQPDKAVATVGEQGQVVDQLDAMIRDLAVKPKQSKFAVDGSSSGGGQGSSPPLPPEAELRLLKDLQQQVNNNTRATAKLPSADKSQWLALGTRQGELRNLLDQLLQKASGGELRLGPEPDPSKRLPEEAKAEDVENQELDSTLLSGKPAAEGEEKSAGLVGDRMARARQRLSIDGDGGPVTQLIQDRITRDLDLLIEQARQRQAEMRNPPKNAQHPQQQSKPSDQMAKADNQGKSQQNSPPSACANPAQVSRASAPGNTATDLSKEIKESLAEWGQVTPRLREAQIEGSSETIIEQYRKLTEDYYRSLATKATDR
jgi:hypothetical protein